MAGTPKTCLLASLIFSALAVNAPAGPAEVSVLFTNIVATGGSTNVFVVGSIPQLGNWDPTRAVKLSTNGNAFGAGVWGARIGIPEGTSYEYKFIRRATSPDSAYGNAANVTWEPGANRAGATAPGPPAPYNGKTVFYYSGWSSVSILYSNTINAQWTLKPMTDVGPGRGGTERLWRADDLNRAGETNLMFVFTNNQGQWDNPDGIPGYNYQTPLDACVVQDGQVYNYWPPPVVSTNFIHTFSIAPTNGLAARTIRVYVPRGFAQNTMKRYPVLYMHDGQNLFSGMGAFGSWWADTNANNLIRFGKMRETIIVGVDNTADRLREYTPPSCSPPGGGTALGGQYASFLIEQLKPYIDNTYSITAGRTLTDPENTGVLGSSMGGLISAYLGWERSATFRRIGCLSSSFQVCMPFPPPPALKRPIRVYLDSGDQNDGLANTMIERDRLVSVGYVFNMDLDHTIGYGDAHNEAAWNRRLPRALMFLFPTSDEPNTVLDAVAPMHITALQAAGPSNIVTWTSYLKRTYTVQGSTNETFSSSMNWSNLFTTTPEPRFWNYPSVAVPDQFRFIRVRQNTVPDWPN
jgi:predicted alpha/beta superfamily hydrolase